MPATVQGDHSKYPDSIRKVFPMLSGETMELRQSYKVYSRLFMENQGLTTLMGKSLGGLMGMFQSLLQDEMFLSIGRLTDQDSRSQPNMSLWRLFDSVPDADSPDYESKLSTAFESLRVAVTEIRKHRHKRIAHFDLNVSTQAAVLPEVTFLKLKDVIAQIEELLNIVYWEFERTTMLFDVLSAHEITGRAETTVIKAATYDLLESEGTVQKHEWRRSADSMIETPATDY